jgi:hypothetical protein
MIYFCCDEEPRRDAVRASNQFNGIDFLEVSDDPADSLDQRQRTLFVHFLNTVGIDTLTEKNIRIEGGERIRNIAVVKVTKPAAALPPSSPPAPPNLLAVEVSARGDFSKYTLRLVNDAQNEPPAHFDPLLSAIDFSFKVACPSDFDCRQERVCPPETLVQPEIDYLAKDYASFRQLILDRMALLQPQWKERSAADLGIVLVELLAYVGDHLSYQQDAVATEGYLGTARLRTSVRRHARLIDYPMHDGRNARAWIHFKVSDDGDGLTIDQGKGRKTTKLITNTGLFTDRRVIAQSSIDFDNLMSKRPQVFELVRDESLKQTHDVTLRTAHNEITFYTWGAKDCCLAKGSTGATLDGAFPNLSVGDVLLLVEKRGPRTGIEADADPSHRHAVRLTKITPSNDPFREDLESPPSAGDTVTEIEWDRADALPFALCISARVGTDSFSDVGVAYGNVALVDHGMTFTDVPDTLPPNLDSLATSLAPDTVPALDPALQRTTASTESRCDDPEEQQTLSRYRPRLARGPITQAAPYSASSPAKFAMPVGSPAIGTPSETPVAEVTLVDPHAPKEPWEATHDLLGNKESDKNFVVELEADGSAYVRFGDGVSGERPEEGTKFLATYRVGNGLDGNVGANAITHLVTSDSGITDKEILSISNPIPARGGLDPETIEEVRRNAPGAFRIQQRAVTPSDYEEITTRRDVVERCNLDVQRAAATLRWTGSWHTVFVSADRFGGAAVDEKFETKLRRCLERYRMAGQDLEVDAPIYVPLEIELAVCIKRDYSFEDVHGALLEIFSNQVRPNGTLGVFHPDNFTFGQPVYSSALIAAAQSVAGVDSVMLRKFQRQRIDSDVALQSGKLELGRLEIARLDNDPNFPERGSFKVTHA